jgi:adenosylcobinamide amidohydrolase
VELQLRSRSEAGRQLSVLVWRFDRPLRVAASAPHGGGLATRRWILNAQVPPSYARRDPDHHLRKLAVSLGLPGHGVGMLTAADVRAFVTTVDDGVEVVATVGLGEPEWAAAARTERVAIRLAGTINVVAVLPARLSDAALVNAIATATEAKAQALFELGIDGTGTATDAVCVATPADGRAETFGGPRSRWGSRLARAVRDAVRLGAPR